MLIIITFIVFSFILLLYLRRVSRDGVRITLAFQRYKDSLDKAETAHKNIGLELQSLRQEIASIIKNKE